MCPGRVAFREIQRLEVVIVEFNFRAVGDFIAHADEEVLHFVADLLNRMQGACFSCLSGHRHVYGFLLQLQPKSGGLQLLRFSCEALLYIGAYLIHELSGGRPFLRAQLAHSFQKRCQRAPSFPDTPPSAHPARPDRTQLRAALQTLFEWYPIDPSYNMNPPYLPKTFL